MKSNITRLFVYGTLRSGFHHPAYDYISKHFTLLGKAKAKGELYDLGPYPAAVPSDAKSYITGELYELKKEGDFAWVIEQLDDYEGINPEEGEPALYKREVTEVNFNGEETMAWIYWYLLDVTGYQSIPSGDITRISKI